ncbi:MULTISPECIES: sigma-70 family RNA polymerase sigma factor [unclassified Paenarthrobacter]|uniref:sigma-70 family RNA polymerase sigma factor n=1 Tax=unclassified Paenarthrobacter TaxID=2634190 RepID=UPI003CF6DA79
MAQGTSSGSNSHNSVESDGDLVKLVRGGDVSAFAGLYERHVSIASAVARRNVDNPSDAEDVVAEAFQSVLQSLVAGRGPDNFFRAYLLSTVTRLSHHRNRRAGKTVPSGDEAVLDTPLAEPDSAVAAFESQTVAKAFRSLPERWQAVLWYLDVERMKPAAVAPILGLSPNAVSALALRAREGLRRQYLQAHVAEHPDKGCADFASKLGSYLRGGLSSGAERKVREHLNGCTGCTVALAELKDVQGTMRSVLLPLITGVPLAAWAGKGAGLGVLGGVVPAKVVLGMPVLAQPAVMAVVSAAGLGLVLGGLGLMDHLDQGPLPERRSVQTMADPQVTVQAPSPSTSPAAIPSPLPSVPPQASDPAPPVPEPAQPAVSAQPAVPEQSAVPEQPAVETPPPVPPSPSVPPAEPTRVDAPAAVTTYVWSAKDREAGLTAMQVDFAADGTEPLGPGMAVFAVEQGSKIQESSLKAPEGWSCSLQEGRRVLRCVTKWVERGELHFHVTAESKRQRDPEVLTYSLSGTGLATGEFAYKY